MDELEIDGKTYLSSKEAAKRTGYAKDYVGQLCREGRVEARLVGRSWYVYEPSIMKHRFSEEVPADKAADSDVAPVQTKTEVSPQESEKTSIQAPWEPPRYTHEEVPTIEISNTRGGEHVAVMEDAWKEWFNREESEVSSGISVEEEQPVIPVKEIIEEEIVEDAPVPLTKVKPAISAEPRPEREIDPIRPITPSYSYPTPMVQARVEVAHNPIRAPKEGSSFMVTKSLIVSFIFIAISITVIATGFFTGKVGGGSGYGIIEILSGETRI